MIFQISTYRSQSVPKIIKIRVGPVKWWYHLTWNAPYGLSETIIFLVSNETNHKPSRTPMPEGELSLGQAGKPT